MKYDAKVSRILIYCNKKTAFFSFLKMEKYNIGHVLVLMKLDMELLCSADWSEVNRQTLTGLGT